MKNILKLGIVLLLVLVVTHKKEPIKEAGYMKIEFRKDYTNADAKYLISKHFPQTPVMLKIASCESKLKQYGGDEQVVRGVQNTKDVGLFQINEKYHLKRSRELGIDIYDIEGNIIYAKYLYNSNGTSDWNWSKHCWSV